MDLNQYEKLKLQIIGEIEKVTNNNLIIDAWHAQCIFDSANYFVGNLFVLSSNILNDINDDRSSLSEEVKMNELTKDDFFMLLLKIKNHKFNKM